jgi:hypothetical protein
MSILQRNLQEHVKDAYRAYPHLLNQLDIIYREAIITCETGGSSLLACDKAKKLIDELLLENEEEK